MKRFFNKNIKKLIKAGVISLFAFSCATKGNPDDSETTNAIVLPTIDQVKFDGYLAKVRNSGQYKVFATVNGTASTFPTTDASIKSGFSYYKGLDRITALRVYLNNTSPNAIKNNSVAILGHTSSSASGADWAYNCGVTGQNNCNTPYNNTPARPGRPQSDASLGLFINPFYENDATSNRPMSFGFGAETDFYMVESTTNTFPFQFWAITNAMKQASIKKYKMVVYDAYDSYRLPGTYAGNGFLDNTTILPNATTAAVTVTPSNQFLNAAFEFNNFLKNNLSSVLVMPTGTMAKFTTPNDGIIQAVNTNASNQVSYGYFNQGHVNTFPAYPVVSTEGFFTGYVVQYIERNGGGSASKNNIALALAVDGAGATAGVQTAGGSDFKYKPYLEAVLPGSLRDYAFSVMIKPNFGNVAGNGTTESITTTTHEVKSQIANSILASNINTLGSLMDSNVKAISLLKTNFTLKQYGNYNNTNINNNTLNLTNASTLTEGFITLASGTVGAAVTSNATLQTKIIAYFDQYALLNNNTINDSLNGIYLGAISYPTALSDATKWAKIMQLYAGKEYMLSQFITTSDVVVCSSTCMVDGSNIISMNGTHGKEGDFAIVEKNYQYYDVNGVLQNGVSTVYTYKGQVISSNVFGNGVVDFTTLYNTATASTNSVQYKIFDTKANLSSVMGDGFRREGISNFLSKITTNIGSVYEGEGDTIEMSLNANISTKSKIEEKTQLAFANILKNSSINTGGNFNLGLIGFGFAVSGNETSSSKGLLTDEARKNKIMQGFVGGASRFGETFMAEANPLAFNIKNLEKNSEDEGKISNFTAFVPVSENTGVSFLASGSSVSSLMLAPVSENNFSILSNSLGFRESYSNFAELFGEAKNIQGASLQFGDSIKFNISFAVGERENLLNDTTEKSSFTSIEAEKSFTNTKVKVVSGVMKEDGSLLGSQFSGGLAIKSTTNYFAGIEAESKLVGSLYINGAFNYGFSKVDAGDSLLNNFKGVQTSAISLGLSDKNFLSGILGFTYSEGLRMNSGSVEAFNGKDSQRFDISSDGRERNFELSFGKTFKQTSSVKLALVHTENLNNIKGEKQNLIVLKAAKQF